VFLKGHACAVGVCIYLENKMQSFFDAYVRKDVVSCAMSSNVLIGLSIFKIRTDQQ
jgi:hypothetical protein